MWRGGRQRAAPSNPKGDHRAAADIGWSIQPSTIPTIARRAVFPAVKRPRNFSLCSSRSDGAKLGVSSLISEFQKFRLPTEPNQFTDSPVPSLRGALRNVINVGNGMRWTPAAPLTNRAAADGEVVWF